MDRQCDGIHDDGPVGCTGRLFYGSWFDKQAVGMQEDLQADEAGRARYEQGQRNSFCFRCW